MKKHLIPKPKYDIGEFVIYTILSDGNNPMSRQTVGKIDGIQINMSSLGSYVSYLFENSSDLYAETAINRRVLLPK